MNVDLIVANLAAHWIQSGLLAGGLLLALRTFDVRAPGLRLFALQGGLLLIVLLPWLQPRAARETARAPWTPPPVELGVGPGGPSLRPQASQRPLEAPSGPDPWLITFGVVVLGGVMRVAWLAVGMIRLRRLRRSGLEIDAPAAAGELQRQLSAWPLFVEHDRAASPFTFGTLRPVVVLPPRFRLLSAEHQRAILCHELLHVKRCDTARAFVEELVTSALWFHPWVWVLRSRIHVAREQVVDLGVVRLIGRPAEYARCLLEMSGHDLAPHMSALGAGMISSRELRIRIDAIFEEVRMSRARVTTVVAGLAGFVFATAWIATAAVPLQQLSASTATQSGTSLPRPLERDQNAPPRRVWGMDPVYPPIARASGITGPVVLEATINEAGHVTNARVLGSIPLLDHAALAAVKQWRYEPTLVNGVPVPVVVAVTVNFRSTPHERGFVRLRITFPDGSVTSQYETTPNDGIGIRLAKDGLGRFGFAPTINWDASTPVFQVAIYDMSAASQGLTPVLLGSVDVTPGGGVVRSATTPSFGLEVVAWEKPSATR